MSEAHIQPPTDYIAELLRRAPEFVRSPMWHDLHPEDRNSSGLVFAAFRRYMESSAADEHARDECLRAVEYFASSLDREAHNLLVTEVFENFHSPDDQARVLLPVSKALYDRWLGD